jgi:hypothetical protein
MPLNDNILFFCDRGRILTEKRNNQGTGVKRRPISKERVCSLGVISFDNLEWSDHLVKVVDFSVIGIGVESDGPIDPGIIWFNESLYGQRCGLLVWCKKTGICYRAGIKFISFTREQEEYLRQQVERIQHVKRLQDPDNIIARMIADIKKDIANSSD